MRKKHPEHVNLERWLVSYADFITLLFAFFVIMYAISQADLSKFQKVSQGLKQAFASGPVGMIDLGGTGGGTTANPFDVTERSTGRVIDLPAGKTNTAGEPDPEIADIKERLEEAISLEVGATELSEKLEMQYDSQGLVVRIATKDFFSPGSIEVQPDLRPILDRIARIIFKTKRIIRIEGHIDDAEVNTPGFASGWELSTARAAWVAKYWIKKFDVNPALIGVAGYSSFHPLTQKKDAYSRSKNRRVEVIVLNNRYETK
ncbi:MAG: flagellar motor protein MotB [Bdellovibrio sp.]|nr:flagellar motor protein MotB [Bdellovibrio sp.]